MSVVWSWIVSRVTALWAIPLVQQIFSYGLIGLMVFLFLIGLRKQGENAGETKAQLEIKTRELKAQRKVLKDVQRARDTERDVHAGIAAGGVRDQGPWFRD